MGTGKPMIVWLWVCMVTGTSQKLLYPGNTVPIFMVFKWVCAGMPVPGFRSGE
jgi:hypothetical protein